MKPEEKARQRIDQLLEAAGWKVQDRRELNLGAALGVAVRYSSLSEEQKRAVLSDKRCLQILAGASAAVITCDR